MVDIVALFFLCRINGKLAVQKGLKASQWRLYTILAWFVAEVMGLMLGMLLFGQDNLTGLMALGLVSAFGGYLYIKHLLEKKPDVLEDDINKIGTDDLQPPRR